MKEKDNNIFEPTKKLNKDIKLNKYQTGSIKTKLKLIKMLGQKLLKPKKVQL